MKINDERPKVSFFKVAAFGLKLSFRVFPVFFIVFNLIQIAHGIMFGFSTFVTQQFYDSVADVLTKNESLSRVYMMIAALGLTFIAREVLNGVSNFMYDVSFNKMKGETAKIIHDKMARIDPVCLEDTKLHDDIEKASEGAGTVIYIISISMLIFTFYLPYFIFMGFYLHYLKPQFVLAIVLLFVPILLSQFIRTGIIAKFEDKAAPIRRQYDYYYQTITDRQYFKETRILGAYSFFMGRFLENLKNLGKAELKANRKTNLLELCIGLLSAAGYAGILYMLVTALLAGEITVGAFAAVFSSIGMLFALMNEMIKMHIGNIASGMGKAHNFIRFMEMPERGGVDCEPVFNKGIVADNVSFTYPHAENKSVDGVSLEIKAGETVAIVGENGAGKTTLVRLLMGLYTPTEGKVFLNGMDTTRANNRSIFKGLSGVFQKYQRYQMTLEENIQISDTADKRTIDEVTAQASIDIKDKSFPDGASTMLSREFDGVDLSGGEWQRVAIARGLYRAHNVVVLDEPTAAIDPIEESRIYRKFMEISKGKTAIIVTHRLGSTKIADRVIVMDKGKIVDIGTHYELINKNGLYAEMFNSQASWYEEA
jgi:ATP-binding cassette subfamily B protein